MNCKKYLLGLVTMGLVTACTDLDPEIYSNLTTTNAYSTESDIEAAVVGLYSDMNPYPGDAWLYYGGYMIMITDYATDIGYSTAAGDPTKLSNMTYDASNRYFSNNWRDMYNVVSNANTILDNVDAVNMSEEKKNLVKGQAKFLRAMAYRDLTDAWGAVPFITSLVKNPFTMNDATLTPVSEIEATLISDLKECINLLPASWSGQDLARATSGAAATLLGKIYLRNHDYANAKTYIDMVLNSGQYELESDFKYVWSENNKYGKEMIFAYCMKREIMLPRLPVTLVLRIIRKYRGVGNIMAYPFRFGVVMTKKIHAVSSFIMIIREMQNGMINLITVSITWFRKRG